MQTKMIFLDIDGTLVNDKKEFSDNEFRYLQKFPTFTFDNLKEGTYIEELEDNS